jgi:hypothetical protein
MSKSLEIDLTGISVCILMPNYQGEVPMDTMVSMLKTQETLTNMGIPLDFLFERGNALVDSARNNLVAHYLKQSNAKKMFFIDSDMAWTPDDFIRILGFSTIYPSIAATYTTRSDNPHKFFLNVGEENKVVFNEHGLLRVEGLGLGFSCFDRELIEEVSKKARKYKTEEGMIARLFKIGMSKKGKYQGEDISFFKLLKELGYYTWVDLDITLTHIGTKLYKASPREALEKLNYQLEKE